MHAADVGLVIVDVPEDVDLALLLAEGQDATQGDGTPTYLKNAAGMSGFAPAQEQLRTLSRGAVEILPEDEFLARLEKVFGLMQGEMSVLQVEKKIKTRVKSQMERTQREYYLNEQMKAIQKELGEMDDAPNDLDDLEKRINDSGMGKEALEKATSELNKLKMMSPMSAEATVVRNYIDWMLNVPWKKRSRIRKDLAKAEEILEADHYGLEKVKERIVEYLAVQSLVGKLKGPILCFVGPPGTGKTSLAKAIAMGGAAQMDPMDVPNVGRFVMLSDPQGAMFYIMTAPPA